MFRRGATVAGWGVAGIMLAAALFAGAFAVAGTRLTEPATPIRVSAPALVPEDTPSAKADADARAGEHSAPPPTPTSSASTDRPTGSLTIATPTGSDDRNRGSGGGESGDD